MMFYSACALAGFMLGTYVLYAIAFKFLMLVAFLALGVVGVLCIVKKLRSFILTFVVFALFAGLGLFEMNICSTPSRFLDEFVTVTGRICELPYESNGLWCYTVECKEIEYAEVKEKFKCRVSVYSENKYALDDTVKVSGFLWLHNDVKNPGMFNNYQYQKAKGIDYKITSLDDSISDEKIKSYTPYSIMNRLRDKIGKIIDEKFSGQNASLLKVIAINFRKDLDSDYTNTLNMTGVLRCLYTPYFHMALVFGFFKLFEKKVCAQKRNVLICIFCVFYLLVNPYVLTARKLSLFVLLTGFLKAKELLFRETDVLFLVVLICGMQNPYILYNEGFLISCLITLFIILFFKKIFHRISYINTHKKILRFIVMFFICVIMIMPVVAFLFDYTSVYSMLVSTVLMPVINIITVIFPLALVDGFSLAVKITDILVGIVAYLPEIVRRLPFYYVLLPKPYFSVIVGYLVLLYGIYYRESKRKFLCCVSVCAGLILNCGVSEVLRMNKPTVTFLSAGYGDCTVTEIPYKCTIMVDGSGYVEYNENYDVGKRDIFPYLRNENIRDLDYVFVSHYHKDHIDGIISLLDVMKIKNIYLPDCLDKNKYRIKLESEARKNNVKIHYISDNTSFELEDGVLCEVLNFDALAKDENDTSVVMRLSYNGISCLYTGDISGKTEKKLLESGVDLSADILKVAHHGSGTSSSEEFLTAVNPEFGVVMTPKNNVYDFPAVSTVENFKKLDIPLLVTADEKCIQIKESKGELVWRRKTR